MRLIALLSCSWLALGGCASMSDGSGSQAWLVPDYVVGAVYELQQDRLVERKGGPLIWSYHALRPSSVLSESLDSPRSVAQYESDPRRWPSVIGVLQKGTRMRIIDVSRHGPFLTLDAWYEVEGEVLNGRHQGLRVDLVGISKQERISGYRYVPDVDPTELKLVSDP